MGYKICGSTITLTRGDSLKAYVEMTEDGKTFSARSSDRVRFAMKKSYEDAEPLLVKEIPTDTMLLSLAPEDTKQLSFGAYVYDIELTTADGEVDTFIPKGKIKITEEVD